jgi:Domain of unknown function (DUF4123)
VDIIPARLPFDAEQLLNFLWPLEVADQEVLLLTDNRNPAQLLKRAREADLTCMCLWDGEIPPDLADQAPWLIRLEWSHEPSSKIAVEAYQRQAGLFLQTRCSLGELRRGLAEFSAAEVSHHWQLFPFYEPAVFPVLLEVIPPRLAAELFEGIDAFCCPGPVSNHILQFKLLDDGEVWRTEVHLPTGYRAEAAVKAKDGLEHRPERTPEIGEPTGSTYRPDGPLIIREAQLEVFERDQVLTVLGDRAATLPLRFSISAWNAIEQARQRRVAQLLEQNIRENHPAIAAKISEPDLEVMIQTSLRRARSHGLSDQRRIFEFAKLMFLVAPNFDEHPKAPPGVRFDALLQEMGFADWQEAQAAARIEAWELPELR